MTQNLTEGSPLKLVIRFAIPLFLGMLLQQLYSVIDTIIIGRNLGVEALAGVGSTGFLNFMVIGLCGGLCSGFSIPIAKEFGAGNTKEMRRYTANSLWLTLIYSVLITLLVCSLCTTILKVMKTPEDIFTYARTYIFIFFLGIPFTLLYNTLAGILRAVGNSKTPVFYLTLSTFLNIVLDLVCILVFHMGVEGPAIATILSQAFSAVLCLIHLLRKYDLLTFHSDEGTPSLSHMNTLNKMGIPMGLQMSVVAIGLLIVQTAVNGLGAAVVAGVSTGGKISSFLETPLNGLAQTMTPFAGQNLGAGKTDRIRQGVKVSMISGFILSVFLFLFALAFGKPLSALFLDVPNPEVIGYSYRFLLAMSGGYILLTILNVLRYTIQGMGFTMIAIWSGAVEMAARASVGFLLAPLFGFAGILFTHPLSWLSGDLLLIPVYFTCMKKVRNKH